MIFRSPSVKANVLAIIAATAAHWLTVESVAAQSSIVSSFDYRVVGLRLEVSPAALAVPKGIAGSLNVRLRAGASDEAGDLGDGAWVEGVLRGPSFPAQRVVGRPNEALRLPPLPLSGAYQIDNLRLVDAATGATRLEGTPSSVPIQVFDDVLVARVTSKPLTGDEIRERGIFLDESNFRAVEFEISFALGGGQVTARFPVVAPVFPDPAVQFRDPEREQELIRLAEEINQRSFASVALPEDLRQANFDLLVRPVLLKYSGARPPGLPPYTPPPIAGVLIIPGNIGFLNQFFSVQVYVENAAPIESALSVTDVRASLALPAGDDRVAGTYDQPGDDPLRFARVGPNAQILTELRIVRPGPDAVLGTADDVGRLFPREGGQAEFLVEGLREGLHILDVKLSGVLEGLPAGPVEVSGLAAGSVFVRNPRFAVAFTHPRRVRTGERYTASITILNTGGSPANSATVTLPKNALSGTQLEDDQAETIALGDILPGESRTADFRMRSLRTGFVAFSQFSSGSEVQGFFRFRAGVDERGVELSPDTLAYPDLVQALPDEVFRTANRVLGQALGAAQRGLPAGVIPVDRAMIERRMRELIEAGQRLRLGDTAERVFTDLMLDWQGLRSGDPGFDQILRTTEAGREWREAVFLAAYPTAGDAAVRLIARAPDFAGLGGTFWAGAASHPSLLAGFETAPGRRADAESSGVASALVYRGAGGETTAVILGNPQGDFTWTAREAIGAAQVELLEVHADGNAVRRTWNVGPLTPGAVLRYSPGFGADVLAIDENGDEFPESTLPPALVAIRELPPRVIAAVQDLAVLYARPGEPKSNSPGFCDEAPYYDVPRELYYLNYGMILALLYSKPVTLEGVGDPAFYALDNGIRSGAILLQEHTRVAYLGLEQGIGEFHNRQLLLSGGSDPRGNPLLKKPVPVQTVAHAGAPVRGRVIRGDNSPGAFLPVTLTYLEHFPKGDACPEFPVRAVQTLTDAEGGFSFDFVMGGIYYDLEVVDVTGLAPDIAALLTDTAADPARMRERLAEIASRPGLGTRLLDAFSVDNLPAAFTLAQSLDRARFRDVITPAKEGVEQTVVLRFRGRGALLGRVLLTDGQTPATRVPVTYFPPVNSGERSFTLLTDVDGRFAFLGSPLGAFALQAESLDRRMFGTVFDALVEPGGVLDLTLQLVDRGALPPTVEVRGRVFQANGTDAAPHAAVLLRHASRQSWRADADASGTFQFPQIPVGTFSLLAVDADRKATGWADGFTAALGAANFFTVSLTPTATAFGRVLWAGDRRPVPNAIVSGGRELVRSGLDGTFQLEGVAFASPTTVFAGLEADPANGRPFPRIGSARVRFQPGDNNFVEVLLPPEGGVFGTLYGPDGDPRAGVEVALTTGGGYRVVTTDAAGRFQFANLPLQRWTVAAPAPPPLERKPGSGGDPLEDALRDLARSADPQALLQPGATKELVETIIGLAQNQVAVPTDEQRLFLPNEWGYATVDLAHDAVLERADIHLQRRIDVGGVVLNPQNTPIGADVEVSGIVPGAAAQPAMVIVARHSSDPGTGRWRFTNALYAGALPQPFKLVAHSPFFPKPALFEGQLSSAGPDLDNVVLQFESIADNTGRLGITVVDDSNQRVGEGFPIWLNYLGDYAIRTEASGRAETIRLPAGDYAIEAGLRKPYAGPVGTLRGRVMAGQTNEVVVQLLATGTLEIRVEFSNHDPAGGARLRVQQADFPRQAYDLLTDGAGNARIEGLYAGSYSVKADASGPFRRLFGAVSAEVPAHGTELALVRLQPTGRVTGQFVRADEVTPVDGAMVGVSDPQATVYTPTDRTGRFDVEGVGLGQITVRGVNPVTGLRGTAQTRLDFDGQVVSVLLREELLGEVTGRVIWADGLSLVPGAAVTLQTSQIPREPARTVLAGTDGHFTFGGIAPGKFTLQATVAVPSPNAGTATGELAPGQLRVERDIYLSPRGAIRFLVRRPDGSAAFPARVILTGELTTDPTGAARFNEVPVGRSLPYRAQSLVGGEDRSAAAGNAQVTQAGQTVEVPVTLSGVGNVTGAVTLGDRTTPVARVPVLLRSQSPVLGGEDQVQLTDDAGRFAFGNVAVGRYEVSTTHLGLQGVVSAEISANAETDDLLLVIEPAGIVRGRLLEPSSLAPIAGLPVVIEVVGPGTRRTSMTRLTDADGQFEFDGVRVQATRWELAADAVSFVGQVRRRGTLSANGEIQDLGDLVMDSVALSVTASDPPGGSDAVPTSGPFRVEFSESLDPESVDARGVYLANGAGARLPATLQIRDGPGGPGSAIVIEPERPLLEEAAYQFVVIDGDRINLGGSIAAHGPRDLNGLPLRATFQSGFRTRDETPPGIASLIPEVDAVQVDPLIVPRLTFTEPINPTGLILTLTGPSGAIAGAASVILNGLGVRFVPAQPLLPNARYLFVVDGVADLAGNLLPNQPLAVSFATIDTLGPRIAQLRLAGGATPTGGATVGVEAVLTEPEPGVRLRVSANGAVVGETTTPGELTVPFTLPQSGVVVLAALAIDRFGNEGPLASLPLTITANQPPGIVFTQLLPAGDTVPTGTDVAIRVSAVDDSAVAELRASLGGALVIPLRTSSGSPLVLSGTVPANAGPSSITAFATALDNSGLSSGPKTFSLPVSDGTPPSVAITAPAVSTKFTAGQKLSLAVQAADNFGVTEVEVRVGGGFTSTSQVAVDPVPGTNDLALAVPIPAAIPNDGRSFIVTVKAKDAAGIESPPVSRTFALEDLAAPTLVSVSPFAGQGNVRVLSPVLVTFDHALDSTTLDETTFAVLEGGTTPVAGSRTIEGSDRTLRFAPAEPLRFGTGYTVMTTAGLRGANGVAAAPMQSTFTVTSFVIAQPAANSTVVEGQVVRFQADGPNVAGIGSVVFVLPNGAEFTALAPGFASDITIPTLAVLGAAPRLFGARAIISGIARPLPSIALNVRANHAPIAVDDALTVSSGEATSIVAATTLFANDSDPDQDALELTSFTQPMVGTASSGGAGVIVYAPPSGFAGVDRFTYTLSDAYGLSDTAEVTVTVGANRRPFVPGGSGSAFALHFDGAGDFLRVADDPALRPEAFTIEAWVRPEALGNGHRVIAVKSTSGGWNDGFGLANYSGNANAHLFVNQFNQPHPSTPLALDTWQHLAGTYDGNTLRLYRNGELQEAVDVGQPIQQSVADLAIGGQFGTYVWQGALDEVRFWDRALSADEIATRHTQALAGTEEHLVARWGFEEGEGTLAANSASAAHPAAFPTPLSQRPTWVISSAPIAGPGTALPEDSVAAFALPGEDPDGTPVMVTVLTLPFHGRLFQTTDGTSPGPEILTVPAPVADAERRVVYVPAADFNGLDVLRYELSDGTLTSAPAAFRLVVSAVPDDPVPVADAFATQEDVPLTTTSVLANDRHPDALPLAVLDFTMPVSGATLEYLGDGRFRYAPPAGFSGNDSFAYRVTDGQRTGGPATVTITVNPGATVSWINPAGGSWQIAANWSSGVVPGAASRVRIDLPGTYTVTVPAQVVVVTRVEVGGPNSHPTLQIAGATFSAVLGCSVKADAALQFDHGTISGSSIQIEAGANLVMQTGSSRTLLNTHLEVVGTVTHDGGPIVLRDTEIRTLPDGVWLARGGGLSWSGLPAEVRRFTNAGVLRRQGSGAYAMDRVDLANTGALEVLEGELQVGPGTSSVDVHVPSPGILTFVRSDFTFEPGTGLLGTGTLQIGSGTSVTIHRLATIGPLTVAGDLDLDVAGTAQQLTLQPNGRLMLGDTLAVTQSATWNSGTIEGGVLQIANGASLAILTGASRTLSQTRLEIAGIATHEAGNLVLRDAEIRTVGGGSWVARGGGLSWSGIPTESRVFTNVGSLRREGGGSYALDRTELVNQGALEIVDGELRVGGGSSVGDVTVPAGGTLVFVRDTFAFGTGAGLLGAGRIEVGNSAHVVAQHLATTGPLIVSGTLEVGVAGTAQELTVNLSGQLRLSDTLAVSQSAIWESGTISGGVLRIGSAATFTSRTATSRTLLNSRLEVLGTASHEAGFLVLRDAEIHTLPGALWMAQSGGISWSGILSESRRFNNEGTIVHDDAASYTFTRTTLANRGAIEVRAGALSLSSSELVQSEASGRIQLDGGALSFNTPQVITAGVVSGTGAITGNLTSGAIVRPGNPVGRLTITGSFVQTSAGRLELELGGPPGTGPNDQLAVSGNATLAGTLALALANGHVPVEAETYTILTHTARTGDFTGFEGLALPSVTFTPHAGNTQYTLTAGPGTGGFLAAPEIYAIEMVAGTTAASADSSPESASDSIILRWRAPLGGRFVVESSDDLAGWKLAGGAVTDLGGRRYESRLALTRSDCRFFRIGQVRPAAAALKALR